MSQNRQGQTLPGTRTLQKIHVASTAWFAVCVCYLVVLGLRQAGVNWWVIFSLTGHSALIIFLLISLYLFAIFRGVARGQKKEIEHPLTSSIYYSLFYDISPFLGALAGGLGAIGVNRITHCFVLVATGSLSATFLVWIIVDPAMSLFEMMLPSSRRHRQRRLIQARIERQRAQEEKDHLLAQIEADEQRQQLHLNELLVPYAAKLASLMDNCKTTDRNKETEVVDIGVNAWQLGGLDCMRQLHSMAIDTYKKNFQSRTIIDYISIWWDGIGSWQNPSIPERIGIRA